jgi:ABC-type amino acid transport substrate-binding protein
VIVLGVTKPALNSSHGKFSFNLYRYIFKKLGFSLKIETFPPIRLAERTRTGAIDGELIRMSSYGKNKSFLTKVEESHFSFSIAAYSAKLNLKIKDWSDLRGLDIAYRRGVKVVENEVLNINKEDKLHSFQNVIQALSLVDAKRMDAYVGVEYFTDELIEKNKLKTKKLKVLKTDHAHVFLGKKFSYLAPVITKELRKMKRNGEYDKIRLGMNK